MVFLISLRYNLNVDTNIDSSGFVCSNFLVLLPLHQATNGNEAIQEDPIETWV